VLSNEQVLTPVRFVFEQHRFVVSVSLRVERANRRAPSTCSSSAIAFETVGCETPQSRAAALNEPSRATAVA